MTYRVLIDDNFHYMDEKERTTFGDFESLAEAIAACKKIVDDCLNGDYKPGMTAEALYSNYTMFGDDPWISGGDGAPFSAWDYAQERCAEICAQDHHVPETKR